MKKLIALSLIAAITMLAGALVAPIHAQTGDPKPTFISPTPGLYVNGWPSFTISYPKDWVEQPLLPFEVFRAGAPRPSLPPSPTLVIVAFSYPGEISAAPDMLASSLGRYGKDIKVVSNKPSKLQDGTPAQEAEIEWVVINGPKINTFQLATKKEGVLVWVTLFDDKGQLGGDLKNIAYSLKVPQGKPEPVKVPPDVQALLDQHCRAVEVGDVAKIMANYSDRYLNNGTKKTAEEQWYRYSPFSPITGGVASNDITVTLFEPQGDRAYLAGFVAYTLKAGPPGAAPWALQQLIKEDGQWKWYGNQK